MKLLVTGASGFVGSWLARQLIEEGHEVRVLRRKSSDLSELEGLDLEYFIGDVTDKESLMEASRGVDSVFHLAGLVGYSKAMRQQMILVNVVGTANVIDACISNGVRRLVHMSSVTAVGASFDGKSPLSEKSPYNVKHLDLGYFETKREAEVLVQQAVQNKQIDAVMLNPSTIYGPGDARKGSRKTQLKVAQGKLPFYTSGGVSIISVQEVVRATIQAWKVGPTGERYILSGDNILIKDLFHIIAHEAGVKPPPIYLPNAVVKILGKLGDTLEDRGKKGPLNSENAWTAILFHWFDSSKAQKELGLRPEPAAVSIASSVKWMKDNHLL